jgi:hypothetical protein
MMKTKRRSPFAAANAISGKPSSPAAAVAPEKATNDLRVSMFISSRILD